MSGTEWSSGCGKARLILGDCLERLRELPDCSVDSVVTDPPYGLAFMGKKWDYDVPAVEVWAECLRVLKPGGHLLAFAGTRTQHRMAVRIEDAGFEIRDMIAWVYGSGFPKSLDVSKAIDKAAGAERDAVPASGGLHKNANLNDDGWSKIGSDFATMWSKNPATEAARQWQGWGTALKPAIETVTFALKPYTDKQERDIIQSNLFRLEVRLWLLSPVSAAVKSSTSSQSEFDAACVIAQWSADEITSTQAALCDQMGTSLFELATTTSLNIVSSWSRTLDESWSDGNTSTTETKLSTTIDWRTLKFSLSQITPASIIKACSLPGGFSANASTAENHFNASLSLLQSIRTLSATEPAISQEAENCRGADVKPNLDPCIMARKPLAGTVAENVQEWGTGAINIDACRVGFQGEADKAAAAAAAQRSCQDQNKNRTAYGQFNNGAASLEPYLNGLDKGRWPANLIHDGSDEVVGLFPVTNGDSPNRGPRVDNGSDSRNTYMKGWDGSVNHTVRSDSGSAARFFKCCPPDTTCPLCCLPYAEACNTMQAWKNTLASIAEKRGWTSQATSEFIARVSAIGPASERIVPHVKSAGNLCDSCAISIAVALVATKTSAFSSEELQAILASTGSYSDSILIPSLASFAELWASIDTNPTTNSLSLLFGCVRDAIASSTRLGTKEKAEPRYAPSRFTYVPKASKADRDEGCEGLEERLPNHGKGHEKGGLHVSNSKKPIRNGHPTVKPTALMRYLCRLVTPPGGIVLDPFMGSGSTGKGAILEGFRFIGIEREAEYLEIANARIAHAIANYKHPEDKPQQLSLIPDTETTRRTGPA